jgi:outer membrane receptor protein involved in Fe transport
MRFSSTFDWVLTENLGFRWKMDWQKSQRIIDQTTLAGNDDVYEDARYFDTGNFIQHDFSVQYSPVKNLTIRGGIVNAFDKKPALWLGGTSSDNFDLFGRRLYIGANFTM